MRRIKIAFAAMVSSLILIYIADVLVFICIDHSALGKVRTIVGLVFTLLMLVTDSMLIIAFLKLCSTIRRLYLTQLLQTEE